MTTTENKRCNICAAIKPLSDFHRRARAPDGRDCACRECRNAPRRVAEPNRAGHLPRGERHHSAKLTAHDARLALALIEEREALLAAGNRAAARLITNASIAKKLGVHRRTIEKIAAGQTWALARMAA